MKLLFLTGLLASLAQALPTAQDAVQPAESFGITWTGQVQLSGEPITLTGSAEEIYHNITAINPNYDIELGINSPNSATKPEEVDQALAKRAPTSSDFTCAYGNYVNGLNVAAGVRALYNIGNGICSAPGGSPGAGGCTRTQCSGGAGIFLCNDRSAQLNIACRLVADNAVELLVKCHYQETVNGVYNSYVRGQIFSTDRGWNTIINAC